MPLVTLELTAPVARLTLGDPDRRNALGTAMFGALEAALESLERHEASVVVHLRGEGPSFCAGFDLGACVEDPSLLASFIRRLSGVVRRLRGLRQVVVAEVQGAALAGGCALLAACDFVCVASDAQLGYPVHRIGVTPAVSLPTLGPAIGGAARPLALSGDLLDGPAALALGLAARCAPPEALSATVAELLRALSTKGPHALAATKRWLNELDGTVRDDAFLRTSEASAALVAGEETREMLHTFWESRRRSRGAAAGS